MPGDRQNQDSPDFGICGIRWWCFGGLSPFGFGAGVGGLGLVLVGGRQDGHRCQRTAGLGTQLFHLLFRVLGTL